MFVLKRSDRVSGLPSGGRIDLFGVDLTGPAPVRPSDHLGAAMLLVSPDSTRTDADGGHGGTGHQRH